MNTIISFLKLIRFNNLLMILATLVMSYYCLNDYLLFSDLLNKKFLFLIIATLLTSAGGYIINDYYDVKLDLVNKPQKVIVGNHISRRWAMLLHIWFNGIAILLAVLISAKVSLAIFLCGVLLTLYSIYFKRQFLTGNLVIALLSGFAVFILKLFEHSISLQLILAYSIFAFLISLIREIIKDTEDMKGDSKFDCKTIPIVIGVRKTKRILIYLTSIFIISLFSYVFIAIGNIHVEHSFSRTAYLFYMVLFVIVPLMVILYLMAIADVKTDFTRLSMLTKIVMLLGMLSMIWFRI